MGFCFFTENTTLNIHSLGLNVGQLVHCICIGGGGGGGGGAGTVTAYYTNRINSNYSIPPTSSYGSAGGTGGITSFGAYVSARGGNGGAGGSAYRTGNNYSSSGGSGGASYINNSAGGAGGTRNAFNKLASTANYGINAYEASGGGGGGCGEYVYKSFVLTSELVPVTIGDRGIGGKGGIGVNYNFYTHSTSGTGAYTNGTAYNGKDGGNAGFAGVAGSGVTAGGGGSGFGAGGGGGAAG
jgi:hypothetical protein